MERDGAPWFIAADVCRALGLPVERGASRYLQNLASDERAHLAPEIFGSKRGTAGGVIGISESGLYKLVIRSTVPEARRFQDWATRDVLPAIRKDGAYVLGEERGGTMGSFGRGPERGRPRRPTSPRRGHGINERPEPSLAHPTHRPPITARKGCANGLCSCLLAWASQAPWTRPARSPTS